MESSLDFLSSGSEGPFGLPRRNSKMDLDAMEVQAAAENRILRQKLESKAQALLILSRELERLRKEGEEYRELTERLQRGKAGWARSGSALPMTRHHHHHHHQGDSRHLTELRDENRRLAKERDRLRLLLEDREEDTRALREELGRARRRSRREEAAAGKSGKEEQGEELVRMVRRMEALQSKCAATRQDLQSLLDEKEDLVQERDAYKCKVHRLNFAMAALLKSDGYKSVDLDWLISENRFLRESMTQLEDDKQLANDMGKRYKAALEKIRKPVRLPGAQPNDSEEDRQTVSKITALIGKASFPCPPDLDLSSACSLRELCMSLLETLNDRMTQLKHQRSANKHIVHRLSQLEEKMKSLENGDLLLAPSECLMRGYSKASVDDDEHHQHLLHRTNSRGQEETVLNQVKERLASYSSSEGQQQQQQQQQQRGEEEEKEEEEKGQTRSPDLAELYRKFQALSPESAGRVELVARGDQAGEPTEGSQRRLDPPDLIAEGVPRLTANRREEGAVEVEGGGKEKEEEAEEKEALVEDPIVLPSHLQDLVDQAMKDLLADAS